MTAVRTCGLDVAYPDGRTVLHGVDLVLAARCGFSADLSGPVNDRAVFHSDNAYWLPNVALHSFRCKTHTVSDTAFRGFGGPQGMFPIEHVIDEVARALGRDPLDVRRVNFYGASERNVTPYGMKVEDNILDPLMLQPMLALARGGVQGEGADEQASGGEEAQCPGEGAQPGKGVEDEVHASSGAVT